MRREKRRQTSGASHPAIQQVPEEEVKKGVWKWRREKAQGQKVEGVI